MIDLQKSQQFIRFVNARTKEKGTLDIKFANSITCHGGTHNIGRDVIGNCFLTKLHSDPKEQTRAADTGTIAFCDLGQLRDLRMS